MGGGIAAVGGGQVHPSLSGPGGSFLGRCSRPGTEGTGVCPPAGLPVPVPLDAGGASDPALWPLQLPIVASSIVTLYFLELTDLFKPAKVGFQCYDRALSMPYVETNEELIPLLMLLSLAFAAPAASVRSGACPSVGG